MLKILTSDSKGVYYWNNKTIDDVPKKEYIVLYDQLILSPFEDFIPFKYPKFD